VPVIAVRWWGAEERSGEGHSPLPSKKIYKKLLYSWIGRTGIIYCRDIALAMLTAARRPLALRISYVET